MLLKWLKWIRGYVRVSVSGMFPERFLNLCARADLNVWGVTRTETGLELSVAAYDLRHMQQIASQLDAEIAVLRRYGAAVFLGRLRGRGAFAAGMGIFFILLIVLRMFVWSVEITGNTAVEEERIRYELAKLGCRPGVLVSGIRVHDICEEMCIRVPELSWVAVNIDGSRVEIEVKERAQKPDIVDETTPTDVIAEKDGLILSLELADGTALVAPGQVVAKGDALATGVVHTEKAGYRFVAARGRVYAKTWTKIEASAPKTAEEKRYTGEEKRKYALRIFGKEIKFYFNSSISDAEYDKIIKIRELRMGESLRLPIALVTERYLAYESTTRELDYEEMLAVCRARRGELFASLAPGAEILEEGEEVRETADGMTLITTIAAREDIAQVQRIPEEQMEEILRRQQESQTPAQE